MTDDDLVDIILKNEGGFTDNPNDHGGPTNFGITAADYGRWLGKGSAATADEVRAMTPAVAREIYKKWYIADPGFDLVADEKLRLVLVDSGVLFGTGRAVRWLQQEIGVFADGKFGTGTAAALAKYPAPSVLPRRVLGRRFTSIAQIVSSDRTQLVFLAGWINRAVALLEQV
jgi:lysozyme family protein